MHTADSVRRHPGRPGPTLLRLAGSSLDGVGPLHAEHGRERERERGEGGGGSGHGLRVGGGGERDSDVSCTLSCGVIRFAPCLTLWSLAERRARASSDDSEVASSALRVPRHNGPDPYRGGLKSSEDAPWRRRM
jgi:hypothetical protein